MFISISRSDVGGVREAIGAKGTSMPVVFSCVGSAITTLFDGAAGSEWRRSDLAGR